ncbi:N-acetylmuramidase domain-containing protein [Noviherbaspirillum sp. CPCC 100848]|uniref:N-acetylmuramidase domain-containing protein n=1 Tax=Noviherbaspirillum album TaxID=3080276 RepID=A0ABU6JJW6_9BURK|nr:N-acetylmuramidase domain-containing protein [Noviherbaspirillum sp. CPCC 100848]MEC4723840.1 N-acetylmuramidase domain-containing protein [Noviherbaspirillum sp. CPCC 100848]
MVIHDKKGQELINIHSQKDMVTTVQHTQATVVNGPHQTNTVTNGFQVTKVKKRVELESQTEFISLKAATEIVLEVGASRIRMEANGKITIQGLHVDVIGTNRIDLNTNGGAHSTTSASLPNKHASNNEKKEPTGSAVATKHNGSSGTLSIAAQTKTGIKSTSTQVTDAGKKLVTPKAISEQEYVAAAKKLNVEVAAVKAVAEVESKGRPFLDDGRPVILFERHRFHANTRGVYDEIAPHISNANFGGYGKPGANQYERLNEAIKLDRTAALKSASWGQFQIMGENYKQAGFSSVEDFVTASSENAGRQLEGFVNFIKNDKRLLNALNEKDWKTFAKIYNGPAYKRNAYDKKMEEAYEKYSQ